MACEIMAVSTEFVAFFTAFSANDAVRIEGHST
jgi:hypothetical protein